MTRAVISKKQRNGGSSEQSSQLVAHHVVYSMKIKKLPNILALHLKRFKFQEDVQKYIKLSYRVAFPHELRLFNTVDDLENADRLYSLFAIVVHIGKWVNGSHMCVLLIRSLVDHITAIISLLSSLLECGLCSTMTMYILYLKAIFPNTMAILIPDRHMFYTTRLLTLTSFLWDSGILIPPYHLDLN